MAKTVDEMWTEVRDLKRLRNDAEVRSAVLDRQIKRLEAKISRLAHEQLDKIAARRERGA